MSERRITEPTRALVEEHLDYLTTVRGVSPNTVRGYATDLDGFLDWCDRRKVDPLSITTTQLRSWLGELRRARYAATTTNRRLSALRGFYGWLADRGVASRSVVTSQHGPKTGRHLPKIMDDSDVGRLLAAAEAEEGEWRTFDVALIEFLYASGARIQEVSNLDLDSIDLAHARVTLFGKGSKERMVPLYPEAIRALECYLLEVRPQRAAKATDDDAKDAFFLSARGNRMSAAALRKRFKQLVTVAGLPATVSPHTLRHTFATELLNGEADLRSVQELLGHASLSTTQIYTNLSVERLRDVMTRAHPRGGEVE